MKYRFYLTFVLLVASAFGVSSEGDDSVAQPLDCFRYDGTQAGCGEEVFIYCNDGGDCDLFEIEGDGYSAEWPEVEGVEPLEGGGYIVEYRNKVVCTIRGYCVREPDPNNEGGYLCHPEPENLWLPNTITQLVLNTGDPCYLDPQS